MPEFSKMQMVKRRFFAMRNGVVADVLRRSGSGFRIIFGLNLPQITDIARDIGRDKELAWQLWKNCTTRESMLLAPMLLNPSELSADDIGRLCDDVFDVEVADVLCHRLLRLLPDVSVMEAEMALSDKPMKRYMALRLAYGRLDIAPEEALDVASAEIERKDLLTLNTAKMLFADATDLLSCRGKDIQ